MTVLSISKKKTTKLPWQKLQSALKKGVFSFSLQQTNAGQSKAIFWGAIV
jgi:hypothetical protein